jgi:hypothetical protein
MCFYGYVKNVLNVIQPLVLIMIQIDLVSFFSLNALSIGHARKERTKVKTLKTKQSIET